MTAEFWAIVGVGGCLLLAVLKTNEHLRETNRRLQNFWEDILEQRRGY